MKFRVTILWQRRLSAGSNKASCTALLGLAGSRDRGEADRARAVLLTLAGWTSPKIAEAFGVREDTVRLWRSEFTAGGVAALRASIAPGPPPMKSEAALRVATPLLEEPVADRRNWTIPRLRAEIEAREGVRISSPLSKALRKKVPLAAAPAHAEGTSDGKRGGTGGAAPATAFAGRRQRSRTVSGGNLEDALCGEHLSAARKRTALFSAPQESSQNSLLVGFEIPANQAEGTKNSLQPCVGNSAKSFRKNSTLQ